MKRKRIIVYYALAIFLPCLILGFLAFRGIKNDQALLERNHLEDLQEFAGKIIRETDAFLLSIEDEFDILVASLSAPNEPIFEDSLITKFCKSQHTVAGVYFLSDEGELMIPGNLLLYIPDGYSAQSGAREYVDAETLLQEGWVYEFRNKDYPEALRSYKKILASHPEEKFAGPILLAIARVQKKNDMIREAIITYQQLWDEYPDEYINGIFPLGSTALKEISLLELQSGDTVSALQNTIELIRNLKESRWKLEHAVYSDLIDDIEQISMNIDSSVYPEFAGLQVQISEEKDTLAILVKRTAYLLSFIHIPDIKQVILDMPREDIQTRQRISGTSESYLIYSYPFEGQARWGMIMDQDDILQQFIIPGLYSEEKSKGYHWELTDLNDHILHQSEYLPHEVPSIHIVFPPNLPPWSVRIYPEEAGLMVSMIHAGEGLYFYIFLAILVVLVLSLFFTLKTMNNELKLSRMKSHFISTVSHEFKSPLTSIRQMAEMLATGRISAPSKRKKYIETILQQSERLSHLIENILDFSRIEEGHKTMRFEHGDIIPVVKEMVESFQIFTADRGFRITLETPDSVPLIVFDREGISQVMHNLLDNAVKYSGDSKSVVVTISRKMERILIGVRDYGYGIRKEDQEKVFSRFYRAGDELTHNVKGSGIGLTIVRQIVEAHHGKVTVESALGKGSLFSVQLPINQTLK